MLVFFFLTSLESLDLIYYIQLFRKLGRCLVHALRQQFSVFKQHYMYFHTLFHPYIFLKNTDNVTRTTLLNGPLDSRTHCGTVYMNQASCCNFHTILEKAEYSYDFMKK